MCRIRVGVRDQNFWVGARVKAGVRVGVGVKPWMHPHPMGAVPAPNPKPLLPRCTSTIGRVDEGLGSQPMRGRIMQIVS